MKAFAVHRIVPALAVAAALAACNSDSGESTSDTSSAFASNSTSTTTPACTPARPAEADAAPLTLSFGGLERSYSLALPPDYDGQSAYPLVFSLHGFGSNKETMEASTSLARVGSERGFVVVTPDSVPPQWNIFDSADQADDFGFIHALVDDLVLRLCIDPDRVFAAGHSNGAAFAAFLVCRPPFAFAAVAMVSATTPSVCPTGVNPATVAFAGTADSLVPYAGGAVGGGPVEIPPALETIASYATRNGCDPTPTRDTPAEGAERLSYTGCDEGRDVVFYTIIDGDHAWPSTDEFSATERILDFFDTHPPR